MILRSITLENFGLYAGRQVLDLVPRKGLDRERPVVLIGGRNGAGKTTLLEAVRLALYGRRALGYRVAQSEYEEHLKERMHVGADGKQTGVASVGLEFDYAEGGEVDRYRVQRSWTGKGTRTLETLLLEKNGTPITEVPRDEWHHFLQELIPPGVSQLFFFDGEKISEIAHGAQDEGLAEAVRGLLGIELVGRLRTDLGLFLARRQRKEDGGTAARLESCVRDLTALDARLAQSQEELAELRTTQIGLARAAEQARMRFVAEGGDAASKHAELKAVRDEVRSQIARRETELRELAGGLLPFAAAPKLIGRFAQVLREGGRNGNAPEARALQARLEAWRDDDDPPRNAKWSASHWLDLDAFIGSLADASAASLNGLEVGERNVLVQRLEQARGETAARAGLLVAELDGLANRLTEVGEYIVRAEGHATGVVLDELRLAEQQVGAAEAKLKAKAEEVRTLEFQRANLNRERDRILKAQAEEGSARERAELASRVSRALLEYEERLLDHKLRQLQREFVGCFNRLARKANLVAEVRVDRSTFEATLIDGNGREIPKEALSAGEKQVYAVAMLWALARTSGRALPMIVDTPLARLDSEHRAALVERYFPEASHQVIVLSTDTEVDEQLLERLRPSVSHTYSLEYEPAKRATVALPGYFDDSGEGANALQQA